MALVRKSKAFLVYLFGLLGVSSFSSILSALSIVLGHEV